MNILPAISIFFFRKKFSNIFAMLSLACLISFFAGCRSTPADVGQAQDAQGLSADAVARMEVLFKQADKGDIFAEDVPAKTPTIGILKPEGSSLSDDEQWIPDMIKSAMTNNFRRFASGRITVMNISDEEALNNEITKSLLGPNDELSLTARLAARSLMTGKVIKQSATRFTLEFTVTDTETHAIIAAYSQNHSDIELSEGIAINKATESLLKDLNVRLNEAGLYALYGASNEADTALAKGLSAAESDQGLQAMNFLFSAASFNTTASQATATLTDVQNRNQKELQGAGAIVMDFFERQELWQGRLDDYNDFYNSHTPFELFYTPPTPANMRGSGDNRAYDLNCKIGLRWNQNQITVMEKVMQEYILDGLYKNPGQDIRRWELKGLPDDSGLFKGPDNFIYDLMINVENEHGEVITSGPLRLTGSLYRYQGKIYASCTQEVDAAFSNIKYVRDQITPQLYIRVISINGINIKTIGENGFMRVSQTQDNELPAVQPNSLPKGLISSIDKQNAAAKQKERAASVQRDKDLTAARERERVAAAEREKQRVAAEKEAAKAAKQRQLDSIRNSVRLGLGVYGGPVFDTKAGTINTGLDIGHGACTFEWGLMFYPGASKDIFAGTTSNDHLLGTNFELFYTFIGLRWFLHMGPGLTVFISPSTNTTITGSYKEMSDYYFIPNLQGMLDLRIYSVIYLKLGYRFDLYPEELSAIFENNSLKGFWNFRYAHNILFGVEFIFGTGNQ